jgi:4-alpha-glucanotransferase
LRVLADHVGIIPEYIDQTGTERRVASDSTRVALLAAMGYDASSEAAAHRTLAELREREADEVLPPVHVTTDASQPIVAKVPRTWGSRVDWQLDITDEQGQTVRHEGRAPMRGGRVRIALEAPALGYHELSLTMSATGKTLDARQRLIVTPPRSVAPEAIFHGKRAVGLTVNLYTIRSARNWGAGDTGDLDQLAEWAAGVGVAFIGLNPLHALRNRGTHVSPYGPVSRLFRNALYIDIEAIPELAESADVRTLIDRVRPRIPELREASRLDYEAVMTIKRPVLEAMHRVFAEHHRERNTPRGRAYASYVDEEGEALNDFATWCALDECEGGRPWQTWTPGLRDAHGPAVQAFRERETERVDFHRWLQFELDRQLGRVQGRARELGLPVGLYQDLAIGVAADGSDTWMNPDLFVSGVAIGSPPDPLAPDGQNWGLPPISPHRLAAEGYRYWTRLVRTGLRHAGALRIDHILGLFRQYWIPDGMSGAEGAYIRFPTHDLLGILALESVRANALIVGEDLGTVPREVPPTLERWGVLSSKVLYFETYAKTGRFKPPKAYPALALTTANTHDMPTLAAFWRERDIDLRARLGAIPTERAVVEARRQREAAREALAEALVKQGLWPVGEEPTTDLALREAVHAFLRRTPSWMVGLSLDDLTGEVEPVNVPGVSPDQWPSWTRRMTMSLEEIMSSSEVQRALGVEEEWIPER